jgi:hypothetical protein
VTSFRKFSDDLLVALYDVSRTHQDSQFFLAQEAFDRLENLPSEHDRWEALNLLHKDGFIKALQELGVSSAGRSVMILGPGIRRAEQILDDRKPAPLIDRLASDKVQKINTLVVSLLSLIVSIGALVVAIIALKKD